MSLVSQRVVQPAGIIIDEIGLEKIVKHSMANDTDLHVDATR